VLIAQQPSLLPRAADSSPFFETLFYQEPRVCAQSWNLLTYDSCCMCNRMTIIFLPPLLCVELTAHLMNQVRVVIQGDEHVDGILAMQVKLLPLTSVVQRAFHFKSRYD
jgi:hypothetical protein